MYTVRNDESDCVDVTDALPVNLDVYGTIVRENVSVRNVKTIIAYLTSKESILINPLKWEGLLDFIIW